MSSISRFVLRLGVVAAIALAAGCSGSPSAPSCTYALASSSQNVSAAGGSFQVAMTTAAACSWSVTVDAPWVTLETPSGTGSGSVAFRVGANDQTTPRAAALTAGGGRLEIRQDAQPQGPEPDCRLGVLPLSVSFGASGGAAPLAVSATSGCRWTATTTDVWLTLAGASGEGPGPMIVSAAPNPGGTARSGVVRVGTQNVIVMQSGAGCDFDVAPTSRSIGATGGRFDVAIATAADCDWEAASNDPWLSVSTTRGQGSGRITVEVAAHTAASPRTGTLRIAGQTVTVTQSSMATGCAYAISPQSHRAADSGGSFVVSVTTAAGCAWMASSTAPWVTITGGQSGTGSGQIGVLVAANPSTTPRTAAVEVGADLVTITQAGAAPTCSYTASPTTQAVPRVGGRFQVDVSTTASCQWTATTNVTWLTIVSGSTGSGPGAMSYSVAANATQVARTATVTIAGRSVTVTQAAR